ncbi:hypothetical protein [Smaragdicoccus niigatensis]|uniref:hypothetical protein n=1 Tax=Smaragdicoccus niigatensis TaxID=359359 RepID=UPI00036AAEBF|nr:hypothetical protein [Smaragdicoccus niigatensis]
MTSPTADSLTLISAVRLRPGTEYQHRTLHELGVDQARALGGLVRAELVPARAGSQPETVAMLTFATRADLDRWLSSSARREVLEQMNALVENARTTTVVGGFAGWFADESSAPRKWKQAVTVIAALIPISTGVTLVREALAPGLPFMLAIAITAALNVSTLTWVVMPPLTRALKPWLER